MGMTLHAYLRDVLDHLPTQAARRVDELLPHCWQLDRATI
jgi:hypothetical protein